MSRSRRVVARVSRRTRLFVCLIASVTGCGLLPSLAQAVPTNTSLPKVAGATQQGDTLTLTQGAWTDATDPGITITDEWQDCDSGGGNCSAIGQSGASYTLTSNDVGHTIVVLETATTVNDGKTSRSCGTKPIPRRERR